MSHYPTEDGCCYCDAKGLLEDTKIMQKKGLKMRNKLGGEREHVIDETNVVPVFALGEMYSRTR
jgi:hypothetical protein